MKDKKKKLMGLLRILILTVCGAALGINMYMFNAKNLVGNEIPMPFGYGAAVVLSGSMEPTLSTGDLIIVKEQPEFAIDDVVVYQDENGLVVHRIIAMDGETIVTQGDANNAADAPVSVTALKGSVIGAIPYVGSVANVLKTPWGTVAIIALAVYTMESSFRKEKEMDDEEKQKIIEEIKRLKDEV